DQPMEYSIDYAKYCYAYTQKLAIDIKNNRREQIERDYSTMTRYFMPVYNKYDYDPDLDRALVRANKLYGQYLMKQGHVGESILALEFASFGGMKSCTDDLTRIYQSTNFDDPVKAELFQSRSNYQHGDDPVTYAIPIFSNDKKVTIKVTIFDRAVEYP